MLLAKGLPLQLCIAVESEIHRRRINTLDGIADSLATQVQTPYWYLSGRSEQMNLHIR